MVIAGAGLICLRFSSRFTGSWRRHVTDEPHMAWLPAALDMRTSWAAFTKNQRLAGCMAGDVGSLAAVAVLHVDSLQDGAQQFQVVMGGVLEFLDHIWDRRSGKPQPAEI
jgi:hypothetical protein